MLSRSFNFSILSFDHLMIVLEKLAFDKCLLTDKGINGEDLL